MAVVLRLRRTGRKNLPCFRIIATDSRFPRDGRLLETLGLYDPLRKDPLTRVQIERGITARVKKPIDRGVRTARTKTRARRDALAAAREKAKAARLFESRKRRRAAKKAAAASGEKKAE